MLKRGRKEEVGNGCVSSDAEVSAKDLVLRTEILQSPLVRCHSDVEVQFALCLLVCSSVP